MTQNEYFVTIFILTAVGLAAAFISYDLNKGRTLRYIFGKLLTQVAVYSILAAVVLLAKMLSALK